MAVSQSLPYKIAGNIFVAVCNTHATLDHEDTGYTLGMVEQYGHGIWIPEVFVKQSQYMSGLLLLGFHVEGK